MSESKNTRQRIELVLSIPNPTPQDAVSFGWPRRGRGRTPKTQMQKHHAISPGLLVSSSKSSIHPQAEKNTLPHRTSTPKMQSSRRRNRAAQTETIREKRAMTSVSTGRLEGGGRDGTLPNASPLSEEKEPMSHRRRPLQN
jgi:hypothetical protein